MRRTRLSLEKPRINMTPMIDVVFLLLTFFVMTFKIIIPEGDFNVHMAPQGEQQAAEVPDEPLQVRLLADAEGLLSAIQLNEEAVENYDVLRQRVSAVSATNPDVEVVIFPDEHLRYEYLIRAMTAVNGEIREGNIRTICDNIKFARQSERK
jgi:biopolymer transport protein ExbD